MGEEVKRDEEVVVMLIHSDGVRKRERRCCDTHLHSDSLRSAC